MRRKFFIQQAAIFTAGTFAGCNTSAIPQTEIKEGNALPRWRGFNLRDFNNPDPTNHSFQTRDEHFKWMKDWGFNFVRFPMAYPFYLKFDRSRNVLPEETYNIDEVQVQKIESMIKLANKYGLHVSLCLHRAPGYCINAGFHEPFNLWKDEAAQRSFYFHWEFWAKRLKSINSKLLSFDLLNEPALKEDMNDQLSPAKPVPGELYRTIVEGCLAAIHPHNKERLVVADGNFVGNNVIPEIKHLPVGQSCRGYYPHHMSHHKAPWANRNPESMPDPVYPGLHNGIMYNKEAIEKYYEPWIALKNSGVGVHCGECGSWNKTPHNTFLRWFEDVLAVLTANGIGYALWEFIGDFGILNSGRMDVAYENWHGMKLDRKLLQLLQRY